MKNRSGETVLAHLDKSHVTVHTYPEYHPETCIATFRVDIDVATCGEITPLPHWTISLVPLTPISSPWITGSGLYPEHGMEKDLHGSFHHFHSGLYQARTF